MEKFIKSNFNVSGTRNEQWVYYTTTTGEEKFVARFKHGGRASFIKFLMVNFTVTEYFTMLNTIKPNHSRCFAPAEVLKTKGYISDTVKRALKLTGYPLTLEGFDQYLRDQSAARLASIKMEVK